jgi:CRP-like cAMP-binding protein
MALNDEVDLLRRLPLFAQVERAKLKLLAFTSERLRFETGQVLFRQGDVGDAAYVVLDGTADVLVSNGTNEIKIGFIEPSSIVGEIAILCDVPRTATVKATSPLETLQIKKERFWWLIAEFPQIGIEIMRVLAIRLNMRTAELVEARKAAAIPTRDGSDANS